MPFDGTHLAEDTKLLITARELVVQGWCQGIVPGGVCADFALSRSCRWHKDGDPLALHKARGRLQRAVGPIRVPVWNDRPERTLEDVLGAYDRAIAGSI
jgi:hypothetical protein